MSKKRKEIPAFVNETEEREFWLTHETTESFVAGLDYGALRKMSPELVPGTPERSKT